MATGDVRDILDIDPRSAVEAILSRPVKKQQSTYRKRPEGISRELWGLISDKDGHDVSLVPTEAPVNEYKRSKARIGKSSRVRKWRWVPFQNNARTDGATFYHYRRVGEPETEYAFAKFNKKLDLPVYTEDEYNRFLQSSDWSKEETDYLWNMLAAFDLRWIVVHDRWRYGEAEQGSSENQFSSVQQPKVNPQTGKRETLWKIATKSRRSIEDMKERFYTVCAALAKHRGLQDSNSSTTAATSQSVASTSQLATAQSESTSAAEKPITDASGSGNETNAPNEGEKVQPNPDSNTTDNNQAAASEQSSAQPKTKTSLEITRWLNEVVAFPYDAEHERKRKEQLDRLLNRTRGEEEEEEELIVALKRIEQRRKDTEKELDKLIGAQSQPAAASADGISRANAGRMHSHGQSHSHGPAHSHVAPTSSSLGAAATLAEANRKKQKQKIKKVGSSTQVEAEKTTAAPASTQRMFPDPEAKLPAGVTLQSHRQRCPASVAQKRARAVEQVLTELGVDPNSVLSFRDLVREYNELREDVLRLIELKVALGNAEFENTTLRHRYDKIAPRQSSAQPSDTAAASAADADAHSVTPNIGAPQSPAPAQSDSREETNAGEFGSPTRLVSDSVDVQSLHSTRKRRAPNTSPVGAPLSSSPTVLTRSHGTTRGHATSEEKMDMD